MNASLYFVELTVADLDATVSWYRDVLGLREVFRDDSISFAMLSAGATRLSLKRGTPTPGGVLLAFEVADLSRWVGGLARMGVRLEGEVKTSHEGYRRARVRDADGYAITVFEWVNEHRDGTGAEAPTPSRK